MSDMEEYLRNWELQSEEVQVLSSIYENEFRLLGFTESELDEDFDIDNLPTPDTPKSLECQVLVGIELPHQEISLKFNNSQTPLPNDIGGQKISYLPKAELWLRLGPSYPRQQPPEFEIEALWLNQQQMQSIKEKFLEIWKEKQEEEQGSVVIFEWVDWLSSSVLEYLGCDRVMCIESSQEYGGLVDEEEIAPERGRLATLGGATSGGFDAQGNSTQFEDLAEQVFVQLLRFDNVLKTKHFNSTLHTCLICFDNKQGSDFIRLEDCIHKFCLECLMSHCKLHVQEGSLNQLRCPDPECNKPFSQSTLQRILTQEEYERWETLTLQMALDSMADVVYCPRCGGTSLEEGKDLAQCPKCLFAFCPMCYMAYHPGGVCVSKNEQLQILEERQKRGAAAGAQKAEEIHRKIVNLQNEILSANAVRKEGGKDCPQCKFYIVKDGGCNKMTCSKCGTFMCYKCGQKISGYSHFLESCILFDDVGREAVRAQMQFENLNNNRVGQQAAVQIAAQHGRPVRLVACPMCSQNNFKLENNNHLRCWVCQCHFCYKCRSVLPKRGGGRHFKPSGCKQHSND
eukprot:TRINITY_DN82777_c0_g1_i10.p1 TRINITY_DN82777_c0_g1~~TRINITY_DN82777_c0_g1_i10.p1  ORF type:complete len:570 (-),score=70.59 TRINITY_DN82777_c0_g1_i10:386-2095(-)